MGLLEHTELKKARKAERKEKLLNLVNENPYVSREEMMGSLGISDRTLREYVVELFNEGRLSQKKWDHYRSQGRLVQRNHAQRVRDARKGYLQLLIETIDPLSYFSQLCLQGCR